MRGAVTAAVLAIALAAAAPAAAETETFVAYGTGATVCTIEVTKTLEILTSDLDRLAGWLSVLGSTDCSAAVQQTGHMWMEGSGGSPALDGGYCSGFVKRCSSGAYGWRESMDLEHPAQYTIHLTAPLGQGWIGAPTHCSGVGTDNLTCVFTALVATPTPVVYCPCATPSRRVPGRDASGAA